jgi:hypothetical protein
MMGLARYTVRTAAMAETRPSALLRTLNDAIVRQTRESMFCTACFAHLHREPSGVRVTLSAGGHPLPYVIRADGSVQTLGEPGTLLGIFDDPALTDRATDLAPGDALVLYTDGVTDERRGDEDFGEARLVETLARSAGLDAAGIVDAVVAAVESFRSGSAHDDIAVLVIRARRDGENEAGRTSARGRPSTGTAWPSSGSRASSISPRPPRPKRRCGASRTRTPPARSSSTSAGCGSSTPRGSARSSPRTRARGGSVDGSASSRDPNPSIGSSASHSSTSASSS